MIRSGLLIALVTSAAFAAPSSQVTLTPSPTRTTTTTTTTTTSAPAGSVATTVIPVKSDSGIIGALDIRPTVDLSTKSNDARLENDVELGYKFNKDVVLFGEVDFFNNLGTPGAQYHGAAATEVRDVYSRLKINNVYQNGPWSLSYENRIYAPARESHVKAGNVLQVRNYAKLNYKVSNSLSFLIADAPILHFYRHAGYNGSANKNFENRLILEADLSLMGGKLNIALPVLFHQYNARSYAAKENASQENRGGAWSYLLWINPEVMYSITPNVSAGVSYYSENMVHTNLQKLDILHGLKNGAPQAALRMTL